tara:strand:+ start:746 stop:868 length:123 start_codon:yes stop_codon:yes gene_type:complete
LALIIWEIYGEFRAKTLPWLQAENIVQLISAKAQRHKRMN